MNNKSYRITLILIILALTMPSCTRIASFSPISTKDPTLDPLANLPIITQIPQTQDPLTITQTAIAVIALASQPAIVGTLTPEQTEVSDTTALEPTETPPPPTETAIPPTEVPVRPETYTLKSGEWPICIARRFDLNLDSFFAANNLHMESRPAAGTVLVIPQTGNWSDPSGTRYWHEHPTEYQIQAHDNINSIACYFGDIRPEAILAANGLNEPYTLNVGQVLQIP